MLVIRLARTGRKKYPTYRIVAAESARPTTGKFVAVLGHYNPHTKELVVKKEETVKYLGNGAQPSDAVIKLLQKEKIELPAWAKVTVKNKPPKKEPAEEPAAPAAAVAEPAQEEAAEAQAPSEDAEVTETAAEQSEATEEASATKAEDAEEGPMPTAASEEAEAESAEKAESAAADAALEAAAEDQA